MKNKNALYRFINFIRVNSDGCWEWMGDRDRRGYGKFWYDGRTGKAARFATEYWYGPIPSKHEPDHLCKQTWCVNPDHLEVVTRRVNLLRGTSPVAINAKKVACLRGHPFDEANTYWWHGSRYCRTCNRVREAARRARKKEEAQ